MWDSGARGSWESSYVGCGGGLGRIVGVVGSGVAVGDESRGSWFEYLSRLGGRAEGLVGDFDWL